MNRNGILGTAEPPFALVVHIESGNLKKCSETYQGYFDLLFLNNHVLKVVANLMNYSFTNFIKGI